METLHKAYQLAKSHDGALGIDGVTFEAIEQSGVEGFPKQIQDELVSNTSADSEPTLETIQVLSPNLH